MTPPAATFGEVDEPPGFMDWLLRNGAPSDYDYVKALKADHAAAATAARNDALEEAARVCEETYHRHWLATGDFINYRPLQGGDLAKAIRALKSAR